MAERIIVVVTHAQDVAGLTGRTVATADDYLAGDARFADPDALIINLCRSQEYASKGYYVSLLADARGQQVLPTVKTIAGLLEPYARFRAIQEAGVPTIDAAEMIVRRRTAESNGTVHTLEEGDGSFPVPLIHDDVKEYAPATCDKYVETLVCMGVCSDPRFQRAARAVYTEWPAPLLRMQVVLDDGQWKIAQVAAASPEELNDEDRAELVAVLETDHHIVSHFARPRETIRASIAVLIDPANPFSPSSPETIDRLERVATRMNVHLARIGLNDMRRLPEYDALFVRAHTGVTQQPFQFSLRAESLGMPVVDSTHATIRCTNKVYLEELLKRGGVPTPRTQVITIGTGWETVEELGLPFVLKLPDGDFSAAVHKISSKEEFERYSAKMFQSAPLLIAQEWLPTDYDWRIGVLGGKLLFAAKYYMARGHWQIRTVEKGTERYGRVVAVPRAEAPHDVVEIALKAARLVGDGFYGVDLKETAPGPVVIEVNDNPNLDVGYEDTADGDSIYEDIINYFVQSVEEARIPLPSAETQLDEVRKPIASAEPLRSDYKPFEVAGLELEYPIVDRDLNVVSLVEPAFRILAGRGTSDVDLGAIGFSNEFADHVFELKTQQPVKSMQEIERLLYEGVQRFTAVLRDEFDARLFPTGMHPWFDPARGKLWTRSGLRIYTAYARLFNVRTHGWMNVQASHVNLPFGNERETIAMLHASSLLIPYLPAVAASSPMHDGKLQQDVDSRMAWLTRIQARIPESCGRMVPEFSDSFDDYREDILQQMYAALDRLPDTSCIRYEFFNTRAAILRFSRRAMEVRVLDTQECVKMDVAIAAFVRWSLKHLTTLILEGRINRPSHDLLVEDFGRTVEAGTNARVHAPYFDAERDADGLANVKDVLRLLLEGARAHAPTEDIRYLDLVQKVVESGSLAERIRAHLLPHSRKRPEEFMEVARHLYIQLADCLEANEPWEGRWG